MDVDSPDYEAKMRAKSRARSQSNRRDDGVTNELARTKAERAQKLSQRKMNRMARQGEADRHVAAAMPKHLVSHPLIYCLPTSLTAYSSLAREAWVRRTVANLYFSNHDGRLMALEFGSTEKSRRNVEDFTSKHVWHVRPRSSARGIALQYRYLKSRHSSKS
jgi:hypothetical protein